jgi:hypothetical protein
MLYMDSITLLPSYAQQAHSTLPHYRYLIYLFCRVDIFEYVTQCKVIKVKICLKFIRDSIRKENLFLAYSYQNTIFRCWKRSFTDKVFDSLGAKFIELPRFVSLYFICQKNEIQPFQRNVGIIQFRFLKSKQAEKM